MPHVDISQDIVLMKQLANNCPCSDCKAREKSYKNRLAQTDLEDRYTGLDGYDPFPPPGISMGKWIEAIEEVERDCLKIWS